MDKVLRAFSVGILLFATIIAFIVGSRIDQNTVSLLSGAMLGILIAVPCAILATFIAVRRRESNNISVYERSMRHGYQMPPSPPQYWVMPPQFQTPAQTAPAIPGGLSMTAWPGSPEEMQSLTRRRFYVIGENGVPKPVESEGATDAAYPFDPDETGAAF